MTVDANANIEILTQVHTKESQRHFEGFVKFQVTTMYYESFCDFVVFFDSKEPNVWESQLLYGKDNATRDYAPLRAGEASSACAAAAV